MLFSNNGIYWFFKIEMFWYYLKKIYISCVDMVLLCFFSSDPGEFEIRKPKTVFHMKFLFMPQDMESYVFGA